MVEVTCVWEIPADLGEGPLWAADENAVYWVDIFKKNVHRLSLADGAKSTWTFDIEVTSLAQRAQGGFVCTLRDGYAFLDLQSGELEPIVMLEADKPGNRFNDGKVDENGRFWAGTMHEACELESGALYRLDGDLSWQKMDDGYIIDNGPTFSVDGKILYHTDSDKGVIYAFDLAEDGSISKKREFLRFNKEVDGSPDGMTVDSENCLWVCHFGGHRITRFSPEGEVLQEIPMPVPNITSCTFAGPYLDTLYITTARINIDEADLDKYPLAGSLFSCKPGVKGLPTPLFVG